MKPTLAFAALALLATPAAAEQKSIEFCTGMGEIAQLIMEGADTEELEDFIEFSTRVGLPTTLTEVGLSPEDTDVLEAVAKAATSEDETIHNMPFPVTPEQVVEALITLEYTSRRVREERGLPEPKLYIAD